MKPRLARIRKNFPCERFSIRRARWIRDEIKKANGSAHSIEFRWRRNTYTLCMHAINRHSDPAFTRTVSAEWQRQMSTTRGGRKIFWSDPAHVWTLPTKLHSNKLCDGSDDWRQTRESAELPKQAHSCSFWRNQNARTLAKRNELNFNNRLNLIAAV